MDFTNLKSKRINPKQLNKANYYLELTLENAELPLDDRLVVHLASDPVGDGGQWDMVLNLLKVNA